MGDLPNDSESATSRCDRITAQMSYVNKIRRRDCYKGFNSEMLNAKNKYQGQFVRFKILAYFFKG